MQFRWLLVGLITLTFQIKVNATHNRAGEITYRQIENLIYEVTITTVTNTKATSDGLQPADRPSLLIDWGDNTYSELGRDNYIELPNYYRKNTYIGYHQYGGAGIYNIVVEDPNRNEGVENIPNSVNVVFSIKTLLIVEPALGYNNTPVLMNLPVDKAAVGKLFIHNPAAYDPDGDSLSYELTVCTGQNGEPIPGYQLPASSRTPIYIDPVLGNLVWDAPVEPGIYNVAFLIKEWRKGIKMGQITRDMQIEVFDSDNKPPFIDSILPVCVLAGDTASFTIHAADTVTDKITITGSGGVFGFKPSPKITNTSGVGEVNAIFTWVTTDSAVRQQPYQVVFKAEDSNNEVQLTHQRIVEISVIGRPVDSLKLMASSNSITLNWDRYNSNKHKGFNIYRSIHPTNFIPDTCQTGLPEYLGFELIAELTNPNQTQYLDNNNERGLNQGFTYCYRITAVFADVESRVSDEVCGELIRGIPIITNVSVEKHHQSQGEIYLAWSRPLDFDTILYPGPHQYIIKRADGIWGTNYEVIATLNSLNDTIYTDINVNTFTNGYNYRVEIHNANGLTEPPMTASTVFPKIDGSNKAIHLTMIKNVPWLIDEFYIYRQHSNSGEFDSIGFTTDEFFVDTNLVNLHEYCYRVTSLGHYNLPGILKPLVNKSHQACGVALDTIPPGAVTINLNSNCILFNNQLTWSEAASDEPVLAYYIYFSTNRNNLQVIDTVAGDQMRTYVHDATLTPSGCYAVTAIDSSLNESAFSNVICTDQCPYYELPNVFTPNGDDVNDVYIPITPAKVIENYVDRVEFTVYSRWGNVVFETNDKYLNWDGKTKPGGLMVTPGVYYYVCNVWERRLSGIEERYLVGFIHVFRQP